MSCRLLFLFLFLVFVGRLNMRWALIMRVSNPYLTTTSGSLQSLQSCPSLKIFFTQRCVDGFGVAINAHSPSRKLIHESRESNAADDEAEILHLDLRYYNFRAGGSLYHHRLRMHNRCDASPIQQHRLLFEHLPLIRPRSRQTDKRERKQVVSDKTLP